MKGLHRVCCGGRQVATLVRADWLVLLTDVDGLFTANPATDPAAQPIHEVADLAALHVRARPLPVIGYPPGTGFPVPRSQQGGCTALACSQSARGAWLRHGHAAAREPVQLSTDRA